MDESGETHKQAENYCAVNTEQNVDKAIELVEKEINDQPTVTDLHLPEEFKIIKPDFLKIELLMENVNREMNFSQNIDIKTTDENSDQDRRQIQENPRLDSESNKDRLALVPIEFFKFEQTESAQTLQSFRLKLLSNNCDCAETKTKLMVDENSVLMKPECENDRKRGRETEETSSDENSFKRVKDSTNIEKCVFNADFIKHLLKDKIPSSWEINSEVASSLTTVLEDSIEYNKIKNFFALTARGRQITMLQRVENPYLLGHFLMKKEKMKKENISVEEKSLFHGTREKFIENICRNNFDWRRRGSSRGHKFGQGVSFAPAVSYAHHYTPDNVMVLVKVLVGECITGDHSTVVPPSPNDTTVNSRRTVYVKYDDDDFYPAYVIHYSENSLFWNMLDDDDF